jgi:ADP-ribose pyrophosphatase
LPADNPEPDLPRVIESRRAFTGRLFNVRRDTITTPDGGAGVREVVEHPGAVLLVALDDEDNILLVRQYRHPVGKRLCELPAGTLDEGEDPRACAERELREETGFRPRSLEPLGGFFLSPGYCNEYIHVFLATGLEESPLDTGDEDDLKALRLPLAEALGMVERGEIQDAKSIAALLLLARRRAMPQPRPS